MKKNHNNFLTAFLIFLASVLLLFIVYKGGSFHSFNTLVDGIIHRVASIFGKTVSEDDALNQESGNPALALSPSESQYMESFEIDITNKNPVFCGLYNGNAINESKTEILGFVTDYYSVKSEKFSYNFKWRIVSEPFQYGSYLAVFSGEPALNLFNYSKGLIYSSPVPVYPDKIRYFDEDILIFKGRDGNTYYFDLNGKLPSESGSKTEKTPKHFFDPDEKCTAAILTRLEMWTDKKIEKLPPVSFFPIESNATSQNTSSLYKRDSALEVYAYTPQIQGRYKVGFADENGEWSSFPAFVFVFLQDGEMLTMSFEYYADKPQVEVQLSDNELYYFVCGSMENGDIPENTCIAIKGMF